ncbi:MAG: TIGR04283 family arsenosugar biosynthesis glycosyltransferase [Proteobacteria bacterium]|nr:TIGR04283 family arsenosugar biosynthesis glycosyltransferase [Pseudomonadota bacterium]
MPTISAIVPVLDEEAALPRTLERLTSLGFEVIVVDGGSRDGSVETARRFGVRVLAALPGRARQMNRGAARAGGEILFFVHADSRVPDNAAGIIARTLARPGTAAGAFRLAIDSPRPVLRFIAGLANLRSRLLQLPWGDQGLFLTRRVFEEVGGFQDLPLMEDVDLDRRLKRVGRIVLAPAAMTTSARRWERHGPIRNSLRNLWRLTRYFLGASPDRLARDYRDVR